MQFWYKRCIIGIWRIIMNTEKQTAVRLTLDKAKQLTVEVQGLTLPEALNICLTGMEVMCKQTLNRADNPDLKKALEEDMYEMINIGASSLLARLFPEIEMRPDVTVDALMKAEDEVLNADPEKYVKAYEESAQAQKDIYEHNMVKANLPKNPEN